MVKSRTVFVCDECGDESLKWQGQCPSCSAWNSLKSLSLGKPGARPAMTVPPANPSQTLAELETDESRIQTGIGELDRVLGGGLIAGSVTLLGGDPGIGKSTLLLQASDALSRVAVTLYASGEESLRQVSLRARRLGTAEPALHLLAETSLDAIIDEARRHSAQVLVIDSIQTMISAAVDASPGTTTQVRESAAQLVSFAKTTGTAVLIIGHVTKEGVIAGPRILEHMVDTVLYFESDTASRFRMIRAVKNRFGAANEIGVFAMSEQGLREVKNPSAIFLSRHPAPVAGSAITVVREGSRQLLVEVQALVDASQGMNPRRVATGFEQNRLALLLAVLHKHGSVNVAGMDVFLNIVGGVRIGETAADLAVILAVLSSVRDQPLPEGLVCFGELGLAGEIRPVPYGEERLNEAAKHGFTRAIIPHANAPRKPPQGMTVIAVHRLQEALQNL
jgi:DNA repair protein RadA/Sms